MSGITSTIFCVVAIAAFNGGDNAKFVVVLDIAISTTLLSYLWIFPAVLKLRYSHGHVHRPYRHPWGMPGLWISTVLVTFWIALGSWVAVFPDTIEKVFGVGYGFKDTWGVDRVTFEYLTLGTLLVIVAIGIIGYAAGSGVRRDVATAELGGDVADALATQPTG
jgi:amino acid transporter